MAPAEVTAGQGGLPDWLHGAGGLGTTPPGQSINDGETIADVKGKEFFMTEGGPPSGPPPVDFEGGFGTAVLDGGAKEVADVELKAGRYAFVCFIPDRAGGPPHIAKGMLQEIEIPG